jgi:hypothetical protein
MMTVLEIPAHGFGSEGGFWWPFFSLAAACPPCVVSKLRLTKSVSYPPSERRGSTIIPTAMEALGLAQLAHNTDTLERSKQLLIYYNIILHMKQTSHEAATGARPSHAVGARRGTYFLWESLVS